jgi:acyl dehydratase
MPNSPAEHARDDVTRTFDGRDHARWTVPLTPHFAGDGVDVPPDATQVSIEWRIAVPTPPSETLHVRRFERWRSTRGDRVEVAHDVMCWRDDGSIAGTARWIARGTAGSAPDHGERLGLPVPAVPDADPIGCVRIGRDDVLTYAAAIGVQHPLHTDVDACRAAGFDDLVVQGALLLDALLQAAAVDVGCVRIWFRSPMTLGEPCELREAGSSWSLGVADRTVAVASIDRDTSN